MPNTPDQWLPCKALYELATAAPRDLGLMHIAMTHGLGLPDHRARKAAPEPQGSQP